MKNRLFIPSTLLLLVFSLKLSADVSTCNLGSKTVLLKKGTPVTLELMERIGSDSRRQGGAAVEMSVYIPVKGNGQVLIKEGVYAEGEIVETKKARGFGRSGQISIRALNVEAIDGQRVSLDGRIESRKGKSRIGLAWLLSLASAGLLIAVALPSFQLAVLALPALLLGLLIKGRSAALPVRTKIRAIIKRDVLIKV